MSIISIIRGNVGRNGIPTSRITIPAYKCPNFLRRYGSICLPGKARWQPSMVPGVGPRCDQTVLIHLRASQSSGSRLVAVGCEEGE